ncbi:Ribosome Biogenesis Protein Nop53 [Manis pentadactyla]|nr:Ribosome Biogenesis Protein Nop53 [Manis pentadactyla]
MARHRSGSAALGSKVSPSGCHLGEAVAAKGKSCLHEASRDGVEMEHYAVRYAPSSHNPTFSDHVNLWNLGHMIPNHLFNLVYRFPLSTISYLLLHFDGTFDIAKIKMFLRHSF